MSISSWSYDMEGHAKKFVERYCELANKTTQQLYKVSALCIDGHHFKEEAMKSAGDLSQVCSEIVLKCLYLARIGRPDILWSVNKLARSLTKWTKACDKHLNRLISYIHHTCEYRQYCHVGNTAEQCRLGLFQDCDFAGDLEDSKSTSGGTLCIFGSHTFVPTSWMCKKQTAVSHSSTESEIISLDAGLRLNSIPALDLWDLIVAVLGNTTQKHTEQGDLLKNEHEVRSPPHTIYKRKQSQRVTLDWLFDRINLDSKIQIKYIDSKNQLADILTEGNFTRDEWTHLLCLFNISHFSSTVCSDTMAKRSRQDSGAERVTAKSRPMMNLIARTPSFVSSSISVSPGKKHYGSQDPWKSDAGKDRSGRPDKGTDSFEASDHHYHEQFMESCSSTNYSKLDDDRVCSSQMWKTETTTYDRSGRPDENSWRMVRKVRPDHEEILLDGTTQSVRNGETLRDRSGRPDNINSQEVARPQNFVMGNDETELELSVRIKIIRKSGEWSCAEKTEMNFQCCRRWRKTFYDLENVYGCNNGISSIHGKEFPKQSEFHCEYCRSHTAANVRHICKISGRTRWDLRCGNDWLGKTFIDMSVINWWWKNHQSWTHESLRLFRFCVADMLAGGSFARGEWSHFHPKAFLQPPSPQQKRKKPCRRELRKGRLEKSLRYRNQSLHVWFQEIYWT